MPANNSFAQSQAKARSSDRCKAFAISRILAERLRIANT